MTAKRRGARHKTPTTTDDLPDDVLALLDAWRDADDSAFGGAAALLRKLTTQDRTPRTRQRIRKSSAYPELVAMWRSLERHEKQRATARKSRRESLLQDFSSEFPEHAEAFRKEFRNLARRERQQRKQQNSEPETETAWVKGFLYRVLNAQRMPNYLNMSRSERTKKSAHIRQLSEQLAGLYDQLELGGLSVHFDSRRAEYEFNFRDGPASMADDGLPAVTAPSRVIEAIAKSATSVLQDPGVTMEKTTKGLSPNHFALRLAWQHQFFFADALPEVIATVTNTVYGLHDQKQGKPRPKPFSASRVTTLLSRQRPRNAD